MVMASAQLSGAACASGPQSRAPLGAVTQPNHSHSHSCTLSHKSQSKARSHSHSHSHGHKSQLSGAAARSAVPGAGADTPMGLRTAVLGYNASPQKSNNDNRSSSSKTLLTPHRSPVSSSFRRLPSFAASVASASDAASRVEAAPSDVAAQRSPTSAASSPFSSRSPGGDGDSHKAQGLLRPLVELMATAKVVPHPDKVEKGGEDAYLISNRGAGIICVADGVGGWEQEGVDPALYSRELLGNLQAAIDSAHVQEDLNPQELLLRAHAATTAAGASTAVVAALDGERSALNICNVGDSGVLVVRQGEVAFRTRSQQHFFNCPFQLGFEGADLPRDAEMYSVPVEEGDTIVMASDGLFDNVFDQDVASIVDVFGGSDEGAPHRSATALAALASKHALDRAYQSPYALESQRLGKELPRGEEEPRARPHYGGKVDDITVLVAVVVKAGSVERR